MIVSRQSIREEYEKGTRIAVATDQYIAIAKYLVSQQIQRPVSEMIAMELPHLNGDVTVRAKRKYR